MNEKSIALRNMLLSAMAPPARITPADWAEQHLILPRESNAMAGKLRLTRAQKGMCDAAAEPTTRELVLMTSAQCGKTTAIHAILGHAICTDGGPIMLVRPDTADSESYARETLNPLIAASPALRNIMDGPGNVTTKTFRGGSLTLAKAIQ